MAKLDRNIYNDLIDRYSSLLLDETRKDVTFVFKDSDEKITAHKLVLEAASPVFKSMFSGKFAEKDEVKICDISPEVFKLFLSGIYLSDIQSQVTKDSAAALRCYADLYYAAEKYDIKDIRELSKKFMLNDCHEGNTNFLLTKAKLFNLSDLEATCKNFFQKKSYHVLENHIVLNLNDSYFHEFFDLDNLAVKTEFDLYMAIQAMVDNKKLKNPLKCLSKIRFLTMEISQVVSCKLLGHKNKIAIISNIEAKKLNETPTFVMPAHLSVENKPRKFSVVVELKRQHFWTSIMMQSVKYEDYLEEFYRQMKISAPFKERTKALITEGRTKADEKGYIADDVIRKVTKDIFSLE